jgi:hypothetical protein
LEQGRFKNVPSAVDSNNEMSIPEMRQADKYQPSAPCLISLRIRMAFKVRIMLKVRTGKRDLFAARGLAQNVWRKLSAQGF